MSETFQPDQPITATLPAQDWNIVFAGLGELPMKHSAPVAAKLRQQMVPQEESKVSVKPQQYTGNGQQPRVVPRDIC